MSLQCSLEFHPSHVPKGERIYDNLCIVMCIGNPTSPPCSYHQRGDLRWSRGHEFRPSHAKKREDLNGVLGLREDYTSPPRHEFHPSRIKNKGRGSMHLESRASTICLPNVFVCLVSKSPLGGMSFTLAAQAACSSGGAQPGRASAEAGSTFLPLAQ